MADCELDHSYSQPIQVSLQSLLFNCPLPLLCLESPRVGAGGTAEPVAELSGAASGRPLSLSLSLWRPGGNPVRQSRTELKHKPARPAPSPGVADDARRREKLI